jgi:hypothetical protein
VAPGSRGSTSSGTAPSGEAQREPPLAAALVEAGRRLADRVSGLRFSGPVAYVYNPLEYARGAYEQYLTRWGDGVRRVVFLGMNPGPWGMVQTGVPFGEVHAVRDWLKIDEEIVLDAIKSAVSRGRTKIQNRVGKGLWLDVPEKSWHDKYSNACENEIQRVVEFLEYLKEGGLDKYGSYQAICERCQAAGPIKDGYSRAIKAWNNMRYTQRNKTVFLEA